MSGEIFDVEFEREIAREERRDAADEKRDERDYAVAPVVDRLNAIEDEVRSLNKKLGSISTLLTIIAGALVALVLNEIF